MESLPTALDGPLVLAPRRFGDERGFFLETYRASLLAEHGVDDDFVQDNHSRSSYGVLRGMHFQLDPPAAKLVRCARGAIVDVLVDIRPSSPDFGRWEAYELSEENMHVLYAPPGFAHGFCVVSDVADVMYKQSAYWSPQADRGISVDDPEVGIVWPVPSEDRIISVRDREAPLLSQVAGELPTGASGWFRG